ncbi:hypothetical protein OG21DRAFT_1489205 [Imleria badia]|nr:hypothetical protein OG21DRAFT_1489205 [Imleria badia]
MSAIVWTGSMPQTSCSKWYLIHNHDPANAPLSWLKLPKSNNGSRALALRASKDPILPPKSFQREDPLPSSIPLTFKERNSMHSSPNMPRTGQHLIPMARKLDPVQVTRMAKYLETVGFKYAHMENELLPHKLFDAEEAKAFLVQHTHSQSLPETPSAIADLSFSLSGLIEALSIAVISLPSLNTAH